MDNCKYTFLGQSFNSYSELLDYLDKHGEELIKNVKLSDIVFSKASRLEIQINNILKVKKDFTPTLPKMFIIEDIISGEPSTGSFGIMNFLDSPLSRRKDGSALVTPMNREDYIKYEIEHLVNDLKVPREEAEKEIQKLVELWEVAQINSFELHLLFSDASVALNKPSDFLSKADKVLQNTPISLRLQEKLFNGLHRVYVSEKGKYSGSRTISNVNFTSKIKGIDKEIHGHIGHVIVGDDGVLHIYLYKTTLDSPSKWSRVKRDKYKYHASFIKAMLASLATNPEDAISIKNATVSIVPVELKYEGETISDVTVHGAIGMSETRRGSYALSKYDKDVKAFIDYSTTPYYVSSEPVKRATNIIQAMFPEVNIQEEGLEKSALQWIKFAPNEDPTGTEPLVIKISEDPEYSYEVTINGNSYKVKDPKIKDKNKEIFELVNAHVHDLESNKGFITLKLKDAIKNSYAKGDARAFEKVPGLSGAVEQLKRALSKYFYYTLDETTGVKSYDWELMDNLLDSNVLLFKNKKTGVIDVISLSTFALTTQAALKLGTNLLGHYKVDGEWNKLRGTYGNILAVMTMELINEILPSLGEDVTLGTMGILSITLGTEFRKFHIGEFNRLYFQDIASEVNKANKDIDIKNNFRFSQFEDPVESLLTEFLQVTEVKYPDSAERLDASGFSSLKDAETRDLKMFALLQIMDTILSINPDFADYNRFLQALNPVNGLKSEINDMAKLYELVTRAYLYISGESPSYNDKLSSWDINLFTAPTVPDPNILIVVNNLLITHDTIASEFLSEYDKNIRGTFDKFYEEVGYTHALNMTIGNLAQLYSNVFERDEMGNNLFIFKNPYDPSALLSDPERKMLKEVLFRIAWIHSNGNFPMSSANDSRLPSYIKEHPEYLWVPLERASKSTQRQSAKAIINKMKNSWRRMLNPSQAFDEFVQGIDPEERNLLGPDSQEFYKLTLRNPFSLSIISGNNGYRETNQNRKRLLETYGSDYFETNVENILIDFLAKQISTTLLNKLLVTSKALLIQLLLTGDMAGNKEVVDKEVKYILDYLKVNVFHNSIMDETSKKILGVVQPAKRLVTDMLLGANVISMVRDTMEGLQQTFIRSAIKFNTDIDAGNLAKAYAYVWKNSTSDAMAVNLLSKLCLKYRLSNTDVGRIAERAKSGRNGIFNYDNWMYGTLRSPDFLNRMTIFVAKCMQDGTWDAWTIDENDNLKYDWKKDKRFEVYALGLKDNPEYKKLQALYFSQVRAYNLDNPDHPISFKEDLPVPYSNKEINNIRNLGDNIFGSYDKGKKAMAENYAIGVSFGMFTTWMNGIYNNYMMKPQENGVTKFKMIQETDDRGNLLFFKEDGSITTDDTGMPVWKNVPITVLGIIWTVMDAVKIARQESFGSALEYLKMNPVARANTRKLISDLLMWALLGLLFKGLITPEYKEYKKDMVDNPVLANLVVEIVYKAANKSHDQFKGLVNVILFFGEETSPAWYSVPGQVISQSYKALIGEKSWKYLIFDNTGFTRTFRDTGMALWNANK